MMNYFFYHDSLQIEYSISIITSLTYLGFYDNTLNDFLLPIEKINKIDANDATIYNKLYIYRLLYSFGKTLHISNPAILKKLTKQLIEYRSTFSFTQYIECIWSVLCIHFISSSNANQSLNINNNNEIFLLSKQMMNELFKTLRARLADCEYTHRVISYDSYRDMAIRNESRYTIVDK